MLLLVNFAKLQTRTIVPIHLGKESLDSVGQPTGEEPAFAQAKRESATENNCLNK